MPEPFDISTLFAKGFARITEGERDDERAQRLVRENREHVVDMWKGAIIFGLVVFSYLVVLALCLYVVVQNNLAMDTAQGKIAWLGVTALLSGLVSSFAGFAVGARRK